MHHLFNSEDLTSLINKAGDKQVVMLGEASYGTHEYYTWWTAISKRLIEGHQFSFIAVEGDWPDCYKINRYVKGYKDAGNDIYDILKTFERLANVDVGELGNSRISRMAARIQQRTKPGKQNWFLWS